MCKTSLLSRGLSGTSTCLLDKLTKRGMIENIYPESAEYRDKLRQALKTPTTVYAGFDATSSSLHIGNLAILMNLIHFHRHGHRVICVIGDATTQVGDPSGHTQDRGKVDKDVIEKNATSIEETVLRLFKNHDLHFDNSNRGVKGPIIVRNSTWYKGKEVVDFVGDIFREVRVGGLLHKKSISDRLKSRAGMNMSEFCYQIFQAYDWLELRRLYDCRLQIGGFDQAGNIYTGHDLIKKMTQSTDSIGLLTPLITSRISGKKLGKSSGSSQSNIWLRPEATSPYLLYQFFLKTPDADVERFFKTFTFYDEKTIEDLIISNLKQPKDFWFCQRKIAESVCKLVHGEKGLSSAIQMTQEHFPTKKLGN